MFKVSSIKDKIYVKLLNIEKEYKQKKHFFGCFRAFLYSVSFYLGPFAVLKHKAILCFLNKNIITIKDRKYQNVELLTTNSTSCTLWGRIPNDCKIWIMWWQGADHMPPIVQSCYNSVLQHKGNHEVILLDQYNFRNYIDIPNEIINKIKRIERIAYVSDLVRFGLLSRYGGIWLDSTILISKDIKGFEVSLYSIRHANGMPRFVLNGDKWSSYMFASTKDHPFTTAVFDSLLEYFNKYDYLVDYFLTDYLIANMYLSNNLFRDFIDELPLNNPNSLQLLLERDLPFNEQKLKEILKNNTYHKLDWRIDIKPNSMLSYIINKYSIN